MCLAAPLLASATGWGWSSPAGAGSRLSDLGGLPDAARQEPTTTYDDPSGAHAHHTTRSTRSRQVSSYRHRVWQRAAFVLLAVGLDMAAAVMLVSQQLPGALVGVLAAGLGWFTTGRIAAWYPASSCSVLEESTRR